MYNDLTRNMTYIEDTGAKRKLDKYLESYLEKPVNSNENPTVIHVRGEGGVGKSTFLKKVAKDYQSREASVYIEVSACTNEVEIFKLLVDQLRGHVDSNFMFEKFLFFYNWFYGDYSKKLKAGLDEEEKLRNIWEQKYMEDVLDSGKDIFEFLSEAILNGGVFVPFSLVIKIIKKIVSNVNDENKKDKEIEYLCQYSERMESERSRRKLLRELFIEEYKKVDSLKIIIIIDNFCLRAGELDRDLEWLTGSNGILREIPAAWIIGSRMPFNFDILKKDIILTGFTEKQAEECFKYECEFTEEETKDNLLKGLLKLAEEKNREKGVYLPYKINIIVDHYLKLKDKRGKKSDLIIEDFDAINGELVSEYFYMDLPEYRVNAAQILSCMDTWNEDRLDIVRKKFNDLLLSAGHLRKSNISIEEIGNGNFKLHESTKDALYKNDRNVIKYDVQEFMFTEFCNLFADDTLKASVARDQKIYEMYISLSLDYLKQLSNELKELHERMLEKIYKFEELIYNEQNEVECKFYMFFQCLDYIYKQNCKPELIDEGFVFFYEEILNNLYEFISKPDSIHSPLYINQRKLLADLYTNISRPEKARQIEKECLEQAELLYNHEKEKREKRDGITNKLFLAEELLLNCRNAYAYDLSYNWNYDNAYEEGKKALSEASKFICINPENQMEENEWTLIGNILKIIDNKDNELADALKLLNKIYIFDGEVDYTIDNKEFPSNDNGTIRYDELVDAYKKLLLAGIQTEEKNDIKLKKRVKTLIDIMFNNVNNIRGNFPWYCICEHKEETDKIIKFAIKTYLLRKAQKDALQSPRFAKSYNTYAKSIYSKSLTSYHNLGVYYFRLGKFDEAFEIGVEACFRRMQGLKSFDLTRMNDEQSVRYRNVESKVKEHSIWAIVELLDISIMEHLQENNLTIESIQYLGNYLLYKKNYKMAIDKLGEAYINRYIRYGVKNYKTLDCGLRLAVAVYGFGEYDLANALLKDICETAEKFIQVGITQDRLDKYKSVKEEVEKKGNIKDILNELL